MGVYLPLPSEYQEVEYIQSSGTQYIHTNIIPQNTTGLYMKVSSQNVTSDTVYCGAATNNTDSGDKIGFGNKNSAIYYAWNRWMETSYRPSTSVNTIVELESNYMNSRVFKKDGVTYTDGSGNASYSNTLRTINYPINIFGHNGGGTAQYFSSIKLYNLKVSNGSNIIADFIPCYRKSDNVIGLYDLVNNQFYTNSGTGTFSKGANVTAMPLKNAYIGEVYEYSYDFRGKTIAQVNSDLGTTFGSAYSIDANGLKATSWSAVYFQPNGMTFTNAKKISMSIDGRIGSSGTNDVSLRACLYQNGSASNHTGNYITPGSGNGLFVGGTKQAYTNTISNYDFHVDSIFDLQSKIASIKYTLGSTFSNSYTITDTQITNIRGLNYLWIALNGAGQIKQFSLTIE